MRFFPQRLKSRRGLELDNVFLREPRMEDFHHWRALREQSAGFLVPWEPKWPVDDLTIAGFRRRLERHAREAQAMTGHTWFVFGNGAGNGRMELQGGLTLSQVRLGASHSGQIGYWMGEPYAGRGIMTKAVLLVLAEAFNRLGLERVEAACLPENNRSIRLLEKCGFAAEGKARAYLEINGRRRDHLLFATLRGDNAWQSGLLAANTGKKPETVR